MYPLSAPDATLLAAILVAIFSTLKLIYDRLYEGRDEYRELLRPYLLDYSEAAYGVVACCRVLINSDSQEQRAQWETKARQEMEKLKWLRPKLRYPLWGLDEGFRVLIRLPGWTCHALSDPVRAADLIKEATRLRMTLDRIVLRCFRRGRVPRWHDRIWVDFYVRRCRRIFEDPVA